MDPEYREFFYTREPLARLIDHGDISAQLKMKEDMKCKSFDWFMTEIAYDVLEKYPRCHQTNIGENLKTRLVASALTHLGDIHRRKLAHLAAMGLGGTSCSC